VTLPPIIHIDGLELRELPLRISELLLNLGSGSLRRRVGPPLELRLGLVPLALELVHALLEPGCFLRPTLLQLVNLPVDLPRLFSHLLLSGTRARRRRERERADRKYPQSCGSHIDFLQSNPRRISKSAASLGRRPRAPGT
jgi:hypothetical protein